MSHLEVAADAPFIVHAAAALALVAHIGGGSTAIVSGYGAMAAKKGGRLHRLSGNVFFGAMLSMTIAAAITAPMLEAAWINTPAAFFALYLTLTAWLVARRRPGEAGRAEAALVAIPVGMTAVGLYLAVSSGGAGEYGPVYAFAVISALAAARDVAMLRAGGIAGVARTARHIWRMSFAFFIATGSYFFGQPDFQPDWLRGSPLAMTLGLAPLVLMAFWLVRVRVPRRRRAQTAAA
jgi:hypothetical protein